eukprot:4260768-Prymnesium_polylepis.1
MVVVWILTARGSGICWREPFGERSLRLPAGVKDGDEGWVMRRAATSIASGALSATCAHARGGVVCPGLSGPGGGTPTARERRRAVPGVGSAGCARATDTECVASETTRAGWGALALRGGRSGLTVGSAQPENAHRGGPPPVQHLRADLQQRPLQADEGADGEEDEGVDEHDVLGAGDDHDECGLAQNKGQRAAHRAGRWPQRHGRCQGWRSPLRPRGSSGAAEQTWRALRNANRSRRKSAPQKAQKRARRKEEKGRLPCTEKTRGSSGREALPGSRS